MSDQSKLLLAADTALKLADDLALLKALGQTAGKWDKLKDEVTGATTLLALISQIAKDVNSDEVKQAFEAVGLEDAYTALTGYLGKVTDGAGAIDKKYIHLLDPLSSLQPGDDAVEWSVTRSDEPFKGADQYSVTLGASAEVGFNAAAKWPAVDPASRLLRIGAGGKISAEAKAKVPYAFGSVTGGVSGTANADLDYYFNAPGDDIYALAVAERLGGLANPFDLEALWNAFGDKDLALEGLQLGFGGAANASFEVKFGDSQALASGIVADFGLSVGVTASLKSTYDLVLRRATTATGARAIKATLSRSKVDESSLDTELNLTVDIAALTRPVVAAIKTAVGRWDAALEPIKPFLSPGTWLRQTVLEDLKAALEPLVEDETLRAAILADANGAVGVGEVSESAIVGWLSDQVTSAIDKASVLANGKTGSAADRVMSELNAAVPQLAAMLAQAGIDPKLQLTTVVAEQIGKIEKGLKAALDKVFAGPGTNIAAALTKAGESVQAAVTSADNALKPVRDLITRYDKLFHDILKKAEEAARQKVTARVYVDETRLNKTVLEIAGAFTGVTPASKAVFEDLTRGRLRPLVALIEQSGDIDGFTLHRDQSSLTRFSSLKGGEGFEVAFLNIADISYAKLLSADTTVKLDGLGNVRVDLKGELSKVLSFLARERSASFVETSSIILAAAVGNGPRTAVPVMEIGAGASYGDKKLEWSEVEDFIDSLSSIGLIADGAKDRAREVMKGWETAAGGKISGVVSAKLRLTGESIKALLQARKDDTLTLEAKIHIAKVAVDALRQAKAFKDAKFNEGAQKVRERTGAPDDTPVERVIVERIAKIRKNEAPPAGRIPRIGNTPVVYMGSGDGQQNYVYFLAKAFGVSQLITLIETMGDIYESVPAALGETHWTHAHYEAAQQLMLESSDFWINVADTLKSLFEGDVGRHTAAFMRALADLAGLPRPGGVTVTLTYRPDTGPPVVVPIN